MKKNRKENIADVLALTPMQQGMLFHYLKDTENRLHFEQLSLELSGKTDKEIFEKAWNHVIETNEMLRTRFRWEKIKQPVQMILKHHPIEPRYYDCTGLDPKEEVTRLEEIKAQDRAEGFDLREVPFRVTLCKRDTRRWLLIISNHHILYDGWSNGIILTEFLRAYDSLRGGRTPEQAPKTQFKAFIKWLQQREQGAEDAFWKEYLRPAQAPDSPPPPLRRPAAGQKMAHNAAIKTVFPEQLNRKIDAFARDRKLTPTALLYTAWGLMLQQYHGCNDVVFDTTVAGRSAKITGIEDMVGLFINTLPLRIQTKEKNQKIADLPAHIYRQLQRRESFEHTPVTLIKEYLEAYGNEPLFDSVVVIENYPLDKRLTEEKERQPGHNLVFGSFDASGGANYDLTVIITVSDGTEVEMTYNRELFDEASAEQLAGDFRDMVQALVNAGTQTDTASLTLPAAAAQREKIISNLERSTAGLPDTEQAYIAPRNGVEEKLAEVWAEVLNEEKEVIGIDADFFHFGGHSLKATLLTRAVHEAFHVKIPLQEVFNRPTIREQAEFIDMSGEERYTAFPPAETRDRYPLSSAQKRFYLLQQADLHSKAYNAPYLMLLQGRPDKGRMEQALKR